MPFLCIDDFEADDVMGTLARRHENDLDVVLVTLLFSFRRTAVYGYLLNGLIVIYGPILMAHFSIAALAPQSLPPIGWIMKSTLPDIALAWADFFVGAALYRSWMREAAESPST